MAANKEGRAQAAAEAEVLLREEMRAFEAWRDSLETVPTIKALRNKAENIRASEVNSSRGMGRQQGRAVTHHSMGWRMTVWEGHRRLALTLHDGRYQLPCFRKVLVEAAYSAGNASLLPAAG